MPEFTITKIHKDKTIIKSVRLKSSLIKKVEELSKKSNISVNRLINECIEFALENLTDKDLKKEESEK